MKTLALAILLGLFLACNNNPAKTDNTDSTDKSAVQDLSSAPANEDKTIAGEKDDLGFIIIGDSVIVPPIEIELKLSAKAEAKLKADNETVIVRLMLSGIPKDDISEEMKNEIYGLLTCPRELTDERLVRFENFKFPKSLYDLMEDKDMNVIINIYTGRRSSEDNLIDCNDIYKTISEVSEERQIISGKLISGE